MPKLLGHDADDYRKDDRSPYRYMGDCKHWQRKFDDGPAEEDGKSKDKYRCVDCGKRRAMKVWIT